MWSADVGVRKERRFFCQRYIVYKKGWGVVGIGGRTERKEEFFAKDTLCTNGWWALVLVQTEGKESIKWRLQSRLPTRFYVSQIPSTLSEIWRLFQLVNIVVFCNWPNIHFFSRKLNSLLISPVGLAGCALFVTYTDKALSSTDMTQWHLSSIDLMAHMLWARNKLCWLLFYPNISCKIDAG